MLPLWLAACFPRSVRAVGTRCFEFSPFRHFVRSPGGWWLFFCRKAVRVLACWLLTFCRLDGVRGCASSTFAAFVRPLLVGGTAGALLRPRRLDPPSSRRRFAEALAILSAAQRQSSSNNFIVSPTATPTITTTTTKRGPPPSQARPAPTVGAFGCAAYSCSDKLRPHGPVASRRVSYAMPATRRCAATSLNSRPVAPIVALEARNTAGAPTPARLGSYTRPTR